MSGPGPSVDGGIDALVHAGGVETAYTRLGSGPAVLLLVEGGTASELGAAVLRALVPGHRLIAPRVRAAPGGRVRLAGGQAPIAAVPWLRDVIDAMGLERPAVVADAAFAPVALRFARRDEDRAARLALLLEELRGRRAQANESGRVLRIKATPLPAALEGLRRFLR